MNTLLIGYDLNRSGQDYDELIDALKSYPRWWHYLDSTWLIKTELSATAVRNTLGKLIDANDELLVVNVSNDPWASKGFNAKGTDWLRNNL